MSSNRRRRILAAVALGGLPALFVPGALAQEEADEDVGKPLGSFYFETQAWVPQPVGLEYSPATRNETVLNVTDTGEIVPILNSQFLEMDQSTEEELRHRFRWKLPRNAGNLDLVHFSTSTASRMKRFEPGNFVFVESLSDQDGLSGFANDGLSDGFIANAATRLRDQRIDYSRQAFRTNRVTAHWSVGWRRVNHDRKFDATYFALVPDLPALIPPTVPCPNGNCPNIDPSPDVASLFSIYEGRGPNLGITVEFPVWKNRVVVDAGLSVAAMRGKVSTGYSALNRAYVLTAGSDAFIEIDGEVFQLLPEEPSILPPELYDLLDETFIPSSPTAPVEFVFNRVDEADVAYGLSSQSVSKSSDVLDGHIGLRYRALKWLEVVGGIRVTRYNDIGADLRPTVSIVGVDGNGNVLANIDGVTQTSRSATYEGFYGGIIVRLY